MLQPQGGNESDTTERLNTSNAENNGPQAVPHTLHKTQFRTVLQLKWNVKNYNTLKINIWGKSLTLWVKQKVLEWNT